MDRVVLEDPSRIEPCQLSEYPERLADTLSEIAATAAVLGKQLHPSSAASLGDLVRVMNCYYSNLIEGHDTRPRDIERALFDELASDSERRNLQLEARAHIRVQRLIDERFALGTLPEPASRSFVTWIHEQFYEGAPDEALVIAGGRGTFRMTPGAIRTSIQHDNAIGRHVPPSSAVVGGFLDYFEQRFHLAPLGAASKIVAIAISHHRFNYIHPFPDGNGRVSRLMSHAMVLQAGIGAHGLWSISRGLARGLSDRGEYKRMMDLADEPRRGALDGRGNLSLVALSEFVLWFCEVALDQLRFMSSLFALEALADRLRGYVEQSLGLSASAAKLASAVLHRGELPRGEAALVTGLPERTARQLLSRLTEAGLLASSTPKGPVSLRFDSTSAETLFPRLFPAQAL